MRASDDIKSAQPVRGGGNGVTGEWLINKRDAERLESLNGLKPYSVRSVHPSGEYAALEAPVLGEESVAAVWEIATGRLVWAPKGAHAIAWSRDGRMVFAAGGVRSYYQGFLQRFSWPSLKIEREGMVEMEGYRIQNLAVSPVGLVAMASIGQGETYVYLYNVDAAAEWPRLVAKWDGLTNLINGLEFSPDASALVWTLGSPYYWWVGETEQGPSPGGRFEVGRIFNWKLPGATAHDILKAEVEADVAAGWSPEDPEDILCSQMLLGPFFESSGSFRVLLPTGEWRTFDRDLKELPDRDAGRLAKVKDIATLDLPQARGEDS